MVEASDLPTPTIRANTHTSASLFVAARTNPPALQAIMAAPREAKLSSSTWNSSGRPEGGAKCRGFVRDHSNYEAGREVDSQCRSKLMKSAACGGWRSRLRGSDAQVVRVGAERSRRPGDLCSRL